ncbi:DNA replication complex GINS protein PSF2 [Zea mays]|uniref:DNA replication complex GINS protein PSF2 n=1 Tax=Zea mays TaxID=4577 RepID=A0A1D6F506_MAIZE|nr:DNA replication complex GINS protein PSF2 [Zea mays]ONM26383.1 DNA replication complex GINS protein PSF2 [Zea mays]
MAGQSDPHLSIFSPSEVTNPFPSTLHWQGLSSSVLLQVEFVAEDEIVEIVLNIRMDALNMIYVRLPARHHPFPSLSTPHPHLFIHLTLPPPLCRGDFGPFFPQIPTKVPLWLAVALKKRSKCTIRTPDWMTVGHAGDDISDAYLVRSLIEDIRDVRFHKVKNGLETISGRTYAVKLKNLSAMEVNIVRPFHGENFAGIL